MKVSPQQTKALLEQYDLFASKRYGQNFLVDNNVIDLIVDAADQVGHIVEIGPGLGYLSDQLAEKCQKLTAYEIDKRLIEPLQENLKRHGNVEIINQDFLKADLSRFEEPYSVVSNLPYYITTEIMIKLLTESNRIGYLIVMMQKEVADKILQLKEKTPLTLLAHYTCEIRKVTDVSKNCYYPKPEVDSTVLKLVPKGRSDAGEFLEFLNVCFRQKRKLLLSSLKIIGATPQMFEEAGIDEKARPEQLQLQQLVRLYELTR